LNIINHNYKSNKQNKEKRKKGSSGRDFNEDIITFRGGADILYYIKRNRLSQGKLLSHFLNNAVRFYIVWLSKPVKIMMLAKKRYLNLYKFVLRRNYKPEELNF